MWSAAAVLPLFFLLRLSAKAHRSNSSARNSARGVLIEKANSE
jgi:hypothetical protein